MSNRVKYQTKLTTREDAEKALHDVRKATISKNSLQLEIEREKQKIDERYRDRLEALSATITNSVSDLERWASENQPEFGDRKSLAMTHGTIGWRTGMHKLVKTVRTKWDDLVDKVEVALGAFAVRVAREVNKEAIIDGYKSGTVTLEQLSRAGLLVNQDETFFVDPRLEELDTTVEVKA